MGKERKFMPLLFLFFIALLLFGFVYIANNFKSAAGLVKNENDEYCNDLALSEAVRLVNGSECMQAGQIKYDRYECNEKMNRLDFPIGVVAEKIDICSATCYVYTESKEVHLQWNCIDE
jgi:hypothetical protein